MKRILDYEMFNEEINWNNQPWRFIKNILKLEEPEVKEIEPKSEVKDSPDDYVSMTINFHLSIMRGEIPSKVGDAMEILMKRHHLTGVVKYERRDNYKLELKGKRKDTDAFYDELKRLIG